MPDAPQQMGRLALREVDGFFRAYYAKPDTMLDALEIGSLAMKIARTYPARKEEFMLLMREVTSDLIEEIIGTRPTWPEPPKRAPTHEITGRAPPQSEERIAESREVPSDAVIYSRWRATEARVAVMVKEIEEDPLKALEYGVNLTDPVYPAIGKPGSLLAAQQNSKAALLRAVAQSTIPPEFEWDVQETVGGHAFLLLKAYKPPALDLS